MKKGLNTREVHSRKKNILITKTLQIPISVSNAFVYDKTNEFHDRENDLKRETPITEMLIRLSADIERSLDTIKNLNHGLTLT